MSATRFPVPAGTFHTRVIQIGPASSNSSSKPILIAGCSVRAAVWSATYAGYSCIAVDQFGDVDLRSLCPDWRPISLDYRELPDYLFQQKLAGWAYTGGLENHPDLIESCAEQTPLLGIGGETLKQLRDPFRLSQVVNAAGGQMPEMRMFSEGVPEVNWVMKPFHSGGGIRIQRARPDSAGSNDFYYQRRVPGVPYSVSFVVREGEPEILGVARQFISTSSEILVTRSIRRQSPFLFCGGITAATDEVGGRNRLHAFLTQLVSQLPLVGLCGIDVMKSPSGEIMVLEINPRYTATMELLERRAGSSFFSRHVDCFPHQKSVTGGEGVENRTMTRAPFVAKQILYTPTELKIPQDGLASLLGGRFAEQENTEVILADQPQPGSLLPAGSPICTLITFGRSEPECLSTLRYYAGRLAIVLDQEKWSDYYRSS